MSIFVDSADTRPDWWSWASCNTGDGESVANFFPDLGGVPVPREGSTSSEREAYAHARAELLAEIRHAKSVCEGCAVQDLCLSGALARNEQHGIWGGFNLSGRRERTEARKHLQISLVAA